MKPQDRVTVAPGAKVTRLGPAGVTAGGSVEEGSVGYCEGVRVCVFGGGGERKCLRDRGMDSQCTVMVTVVDTV